MKNNTWTDKVSEEENDFDEEIEAFENRKIEISYSFSTWSERLIKDYGEQVYKISGVDSTGREAWYFALIKKELVSAFLNHKVGDNYNIEDYGEIIESGYGETVPEYIKKNLKEKFGFDNF